MEKISVEQVLAFFRAEAANLAKLTRHDYSLIQLEVNHNGQMFWKTYCSTGSWSPECKTIQEAVAAQVAECGVAKQAERLRKQAADMIADAEKLEREAQPAT